MRTFKIGIIAALLQSQAHAYRERRSDTEKVVIAGASSYNGLNLVPQLGWNNWNAFGCDVNESIILTTAQNMADFGLRDLGYNYIVLDDCWSVGRNESGYLVSNGQLYLQNFMFCTLNLLRSKVSQWDEACCRPSSCARF
jgi:alpha-galactosidase